MFEWFTIAHAEAPEPIPGLPKALQVQVSRDWEKNEAIRKRLEKKFAEFNKTPDLYADMWDKDWIHKP
jgi:hypothetical protein